MTMKISDETANFIRLHRQDGVKSLALKGNIGKGVDKAFALNQIQGWQMARRKLPSWAATDGIVYPPHLNMEQCSSEATAIYKATCLTHSHDTGQGTLIDLTGGFGVDFSIMSQAFAKAIYVERNPELVELTKHNFNILQLKNITAKCADGTEFLHSLTIKKQGDPLIVAYLDPARRDSNGHKVFRMEDCIPNLLAMRDDLLSRVDIVMAKFSPMLDWHLAMSQLSHDMPSRFGTISFEVHIVSTRNECKELLIVMGKSATGKSPTKIVCANDRQIFSTTDNQEAQPILWQGKIDEMANKCLLVPNASVMKAGVFGQLSQQYSVAMLGRDSHLFINEGDITTFPGRRFKIDRVSTMNKKELRKAIDGMTRANVSTRNFPIQADALRKRLRLKDGGDTYIFATTIGEKHTVLICHAIADTMPH